MESPASSIMGLALRPFRFVFRVGFRSKVRVTQVRRGSYAAVHGRALWRRHACGAYLPTSGCPGARPKGRRGLARPVVPERVSA